MVNINLEITKKHLVFLSLIVVFFIATSVVVAFNSDFTGGQPSIMGHSSDEVLINIGGNEKTLQQAIDSDDFSGGLSDEWGGCYWTEGVEAGCGNIGPSCNSGYYVTSMRSNLHNCDCLGGSWECDIIKYKCCRVR
jgi:hypothetical protein